MESSSSLQRSLICHVPPHDHHVHLVRLKKKKIIETVQVIFEDLTNAAAECYGISVWHNWQTESWNNTSPLELEAIENSRACSLRLCIVCVGGGGKNNAIANQAWATKLSHLFLLAQQMAKRSRPFTDEASKYTVSSQSQQAREFLPPLISAQEKTQSDVKGQENPSQASGDRLHFAGSTTNPAVTELFFEFFDLTFFSKINFIVFFFSFLIC